VGLSLGAGAAVDRLLLSSEEPAAPPSRLLGRYVLRRDAALAKAYQEAYEVFIGREGIDTTRVVPLEFEFSGDGRFRWSTPLSYDWDTGRLDAAEAALGLRREGTGRFGPVDESHVALLFDPVAVKDDPGSTVPTDRVVVVASRSNGFALPWKIGLAYDVVARHEYDRTTGAR
jgi:hypothetical protein